MQFIPFAFVFLHLRIVATNPVAIAFAEDNLFLETSDPSPFPDYPDEKLDDIDLFAPSAGAADSSIDLTVLSGVDASCRNDVSLGTDETIPFEPSDPDDLVARGLENERLGFLLARSSDQECTERKTNPTKAINEETIPQLPIVWPLLYEKAARGQCPDPYRPIGVCCVGRDGIRPFDCWAYGFHIDWCMVGYQYCCREISEDREGIDCSPIDWGDPIDPLNDLPVLPWDINPLLGPYHREY